MKIKITGLLAIVVITGMGSVAAAPGACPPGWLLSGSSQAAAADKNGDNLLCFKKVRGKGNRLVRGHENWSPNQNVKDNKK